MQLNTEEVALQITMVKVNENLKKLTQNLPAVFAGTWENPSTIFWHASILSPLGHCPPKASVSGRVCLDGRPEQVRDNCVYIESSSAQIGMAKEIFQKGELQCPVAETCWVGVYLMYIATCKLELEMGVVLLGFFFIFCMPNLIWSPTKTCRFVILNLYFVN